MSSSLRVLDGLRDVAAGYDGLLCDAWGVIHNGQRLFPGVAEALIEFRATRGPVIILTNAPRLSDVIPAQLDRLGLPRDAYDAVVTSGDATRAEVADRTGDQFFRLGPPKDDTMFDAAGAAYVPLEEATAIFCTGLFDDLNEHPDDYREMLASPAKRGLPMVCANPDKVVKFGDRMMYCAGALGDLYEELGGEVILCGKPHAPIYALAKTRALEAGMPDGGRLLAIGDGFQTDILGANNQSLDVVYVADGIFSDESRDENGRLDADRIAALLKKYDVHANFAMDGLKW